MYATPVPRAEDVSVVVVELLAADGADHVGGARARLFNYLWISQLPRHLLTLFRQIVHILLVQKNLILLGKFALFLQLKDGGAEWGLHIRVGHVVLANVDGGAEVHLELLLLRLRVYVEEVHLVGITVLVRLSALRLHVGRLSARSEA